MAEDQDKEPPSHMTLMGIASKGYQHYITQLKKGGKSGISGVFGSASDILAPAYPPPRPLDADSQLAPIDATDLDRRSFYLADLACDFCREFLQDFLTKCRAGQLGQATKLAVASITPEITLDAITKELTCVTIYLMMLDQGDERPAPEWLLDMFGSALGATDRVISEPPARQILETHTQTADYESCNTLSASICKRLGLKEPRAQEAIHEFLFNSGSARRDLLRKSLTDQEAIVKRIADGAHGSN